MSPPPTAIAVDDVTVRFRPYVDKRPTLMRAIGRGMKHRVSREVVALDQVSFDIAKGEAFGIVGHNGAGKSTLLRVLAGTLRPDDGQVTVDGKVSTLLQLGVGFNPELTGRKNIYLGGLAAGLRKADIEQKVDGIIEFAGIGDAIDRPVKTYSSGMYSRLAFSVGMSLEPEILLLDEVLAVGDEHFRQKSMETLKGLLDRAGTIVFVSHSLHSVRDFCDRVMWLDHGHVKEVGDPEQVIEAYREAS